MEDGADPNLLEVALPLVQKHDEPICPPILVSFRETREERHLPHMYQARIVIASIDDIPQDPKLPPGTDTVLEGDYVTAFTCRTADKLWFLFGKDQALKFKPESEAHRYKFAIQLWASWYDGSSKCWEKQLYQGEIETTNILCGQTTEYSEDKDGRSWDHDQVESIREISKREPVANILELASKFPLVSPHSDLFKGPWASPNTPKDGSKYMRPT